MSDRRSKAQEREPSNPPGCRLNDPVDPEGTQDLLRATDHVGSVGYLVRRRIVAFKRAGRIANRRSNYWMNSPHFCTAPSPAPQGMIGTEEVEFFGEPSISLSEYTM